MANHGRVAFETLGCKLNFSESSALLRGLTEAGYAKVAVEDRPDVVVVNKADGALEARAGVALADIQHALHMLRPRLAGWQTPGAQGKGVGGQVMVELKSTTQVKPVHIKVPLHRSPSSKGTQSA